LLRYSITGLYTGSESVYDPNALVILKYNAPRTRDAVTGEWRKMHNVELHNLYPSPDIIRQIKSRRMRWAVHVARMVEGRKVYRVLVGKSEGKGPLGRQRLRWDKMDLREIGWGCGVDSPGSEQGLLAGYCACFDEPSGSGATDLVSYFVLPLIWQ
jgi:hypothetical protein